VGGSDKTGNPFGGLVEAESPLRHAAESGHPEFAGGGAANLGVVLRDLGRPGEAEAAFRIAVGHRDAGSAIALAGLLAARGRPGEAADLYRRVAAIDPTGRKPIARIALAKLGHLPGG
jgi:hypothetical protein